MTVTNPFSVKLVKRFFVLLSLCLLPPISQAVEENSGGSDVREPCDQKFPERAAFFGDLHIHTTLSLDAITQGTLTSPEDAYRYAKGESIAIPPYNKDGSIATRATIDRPLDFAGVTDHAETLGETELCYTPGSDGYWSFSCIGVRWLPKWGGRLLLSKASQSERGGFCGDDGEICRAAALNPWQQAQQAAEDAYDRSSGCEFTSFVAYEWTGAKYESASAGVANMHRNVVFANSTVPTLPSSYVESPNAQALWQDLEDECSNGALGDDNQQCDVVVIPHNSNISLGMMFQHNNPDGSAMTRADAQRRQKYETLVEMMQHKGASECYGGPNATDELCSFELLPWNNFAGNTFERFAKPITPEAGHVREVLKEGIAFEQALGVNPFKLGFIGSTDTHRSLAGGVSEQGYQGHGGAGNAEVELGAQGLPDEWEFNPGGLAVLYAEENSREALFAAMKRRETYATSGPRIGVRFFAGWELPEELCANPDRVKQAYQQAVPMGGDLPPTTQPLQQGQSPKFLLSALKDTGVGANDLQRLQIIKGWVDTEGVTREQVVDVAGNANNGASVDLASCEPIGRGESNLCAVWQDKDFNPDQHAFYYARVLENPSCRWSTYVCNEQKVDCSDPDKLNEEQAQCCLPELKKTVQERAWTSPIWYTPVDT